MMMRKFISPMDPNGQFIIWWIHCFFLGGGAHLKQIGSWIRVPGAQNGPAKVTVNSLIVRGDFIDVPHRKIATMIEGTLHLDSNQSWNDMFTTDY